MPSLALGRPAQEPHNDFFPGRAKCKAAPRRPHREATEGRKPPGKVRKWAGRGLAGEVARANRSHGGTGGEPAYSVAFHGCTFWISPFIYFPFWHRAP